MSSYVGKHAEYYDIFYADKNYAAEAAFVKDCLLKFGLSDGSRILELACGTGNHAFELEALGYRILATDYSEDILSVAQQKARAKNSAVVFRQADMRKLALKEDSFDAVICLFDSIGYVQNDAAVQAVMQNVRQHLRPDGLFVFEFWHASAMLKHYDPIRVRRWPIPAGELLRISSTQLDKDKNLAQVKYDIYELCNDETYEKMQEIQVNRFFGVQEISTMLEANQFEVLSFLNGFAWDENIDEHCWHVLATARRI